MAKEKNNNKMESQKLELLVLIIPRKRKEYYIDLLQDQELNLELTLLGMGTAKNFGFDELEKAVLVAPISSKIIKKTLDIIEDKFNKIKGSRGIAFTIPLDSIIGVSVFQFLINNRKEKKQI